MSAFLDLARTYAESALRGADPASREVRGIWVNQYSLRLTASSSVLTLQYLVIQGHRQGCCYFDGSVLGVPGANVLGRDLLDLRESTVLEVAALDAVLLTKPGTPLTESVLRGTPMEKAVQRAECVVDTLRDLVNLKQLSCPRVVLVGVVGDFLALLREDHLDIIATDFSTAVVGRQVHGVRVLDGSRTLEEVARADIALVTGMTLSNGTFDSILSVAKQAATAVIMYCESGAGFGPALIDAGVERVISEPHPFYLTADGPSHIRIY